MMLACYLGGLKSPHIVQEGFFEATTLSLVSTGLGVGWVLGSARWRCPATVAILPVVDLNVRLTLALAWKRDITSPLLAKFIGEVLRMDPRLGVGKESEFDFVPRSKVLADCRAVIADGCQFDSLFFKSLLRIVQLHELRFCRRVASRRTRRRAEPYCPVPLFVGLLMGKTDPSSSAHACTRVNAGASKRIASTRFLQQV